MNNKLISIIIGAILIIGVGTLVYVNKKPAVAPADNFSATGNTTNQSDTKVAGFTLEEISTHKDASSCWTAINGSVYDLTSWIPKHPGGSQAILSLCGIDGSAGYNGQHGSSSKTARVLGGFKLGALAN